MSDLKPILAGVESAISPGPAPRFKLRERLRVTSVRMRLILWSVTVIAVALGTLGGILLWTINRNLHALVDRELLSRGREMSLGYTRFMDDHPGPPPRTSVDVRRQNGRTPRLRPTGTQDRFRPRMFGADGKPFFPGSSDRAWDRSAIRTALTGKEVWSTLWENGQPVRVFTIPLRARHRVMGCIQSAYSLADVERDIQGVTRTLLTMIPIALLFVGLSAALLTNGLLQPVRKVTDAAARINAADLSERLPETGGDEFATLARTLNAMLARLEESFEQQRRFTADASHELRTPLTAIKALTSMTLCGQKSPAEYRRSLETLDRSASHMSRIVQDLLLLARSDAGQLCPDLRPLSLSDVLDIAADTVSTSETARITISIPESLRVIGDSSQLIRLFTNLIENAVRHTPRDGYIHVTAEADQNHVRVTLKDNGPGIPPEHVERVVERFYRVDEARARKHGGTGLGLSICKSIVEAHHGRLEIESRHDSPPTGLTVTVTLQLAPGQGTTEEPPIPHDYQLPAVSLTT